MKHLTSPVLCHRDDNHSRYGFHGYENINEALAGVEFMRSFGYSETRGPVVLVELDKKDHKRYADDLVDGVLNLLKDAPDRALTVGDSKDPDNYFKIAKDDAIRFVEGSRKTMVFMPGYRCGAGFHRNISWWLMQVLAIPPKNGVVINIPYVIMTPEQAAEENVKENASHRITTGLDIMDYAKMGYERLSRDKGLTEATLGDALMIPPAKRGERQRVYACALFCVNNPDEADTFMAEEWPRKFQSRHAKDVKTATSIKELKKLLGEAKPAAVNNAFIQQKLEENAKIVSPIFKKFLDNVTAGNKSGTVEALVITPIEIAQTLRDDPRIADDPKQIARFDEWVKLATKWAADDAKEKAKEKADSKKGSTNEAANALA